MNCPARHWNAELNLGLDALYGRVLVIDATAGQLWISPASERPPGARTPRHDELRTMLEERHRANERPESTE